MLYAVQVEDIPRCMQFRLRTYHMVYAVQVEDIPHGVCSSG